MSFRPLFNPLALNHSPTKTNRLPSFLSRSPKKFVYKSTLRFIYSLNQTLTCAMESVKSHSVLYLVGEDGKETPVYISKILLVRCENPYCFIYTQKRQFMVRMTMKEIETMCNVDRLLLKIHRSFMIRFDCDNCIKNIETTKSGGRVEIADMLLSVPCKYDSYLKENKYIPASPEGMALLRSFQPSVPPVQYTLFG
jgi:hypothetical protein